VFVFVFVCKAQDDGGLGTTADLHSTGGKGGKKNRFASHRRNI